MTRHWTSLSSLVVAPLAGAMGCLKRRAPAQVTCEDMEQQSKHTEQDLPPQDRGYAAWSFLLAAAVVEAVTWSIPWSFGILIADYLAIPEIASQPHASTLIPLIGTLSSGIIYCTGPVFYPYMTRHRTHIRPLMWLGMTLCWVSLLISSYSHKVYEYLIFQGVMFGIGGGLIYPPCILYMSEWFFHRRGLANGILFAGAAIGGLFMPFVLPPLVKQYGLFTTQRIISITALVLLFPSMIFIRPRIPVSQHHSHSTNPVSASSIKLRDQTWWTYLVANTFQGFAYFVPMTYVPVFSSALNLDSALSSLALALLNGSSAAGPILVGFLSDYFMPWPITFILTTLSLLVTVVVWGAIGNVVGVMLFAVTYGFVAGGWSTLWSSFTRRISREDPALIMSMYGILSLTRGIGNVLSTVIATTLVPVQSLSLSDSGSRQGFALDQGRFARLIAYIAGCYALASLASLVGWYREKAVSKKNQRPSC